MYFNNAATTWPKPEIVYETVDECFRNLNSPDRTHSAEGAQSSSTMQTCRKEVAEFFGIDDETRLVFLPSCTYALNLAILGQAWTKDDVVIMSGLEHHAVSRPIRKLSRERGVEFKISPYTPEKPFDLDWLEEELKTGKVKMVACTMAANVTGDILPSIEIGQLCKKYGVRYLVDAAQSAGVLPVDVKELNADFMTFAGHKGLFGPPGIGGLFVREVKKAALFSQFLLNKALSVLRNIVCQTGGSKRFPLPDHCSRQNEKYLRQVSHLAPRVSCTKMQFRRQRRFKRRYHDSQWKKN